MAKTITLVRRSALKEMMPSPDVEHMTGPLGDYVAVRPMGRKPTAVRQRRMEQRRRDAGQKPLRVWVSPEVYAAADAARLPGETWAEMFERHFVTGNKK